MTKEAEDLRSPQDLEAEKSVLGAVLLHDDTLDLIAASVRVSDFFRKAHRLIYAAMLDLREQRRPVEFVTLKAKLAESNRLDDVGGPAYLSSLVNGLPRGSNVEHYAAIVRTMSIRRQLQAIGSKLVQDASDSEDTALDLIAKADTRLMQLAAEEVSGDLVPAKQLVDELFPVLEQAHAQRSAITGLATRWRELDEMTAGLHPGHLILLAARPGAGKSAMVVNLAFHVASTKQPAAIFSLEMSGQELAYRVTAAEAGVSLFRMRSGYLVDRDWAPLANAMAAISESALYVDESAVLTVPELRAKCRRLQMSVGLGLVVIDYLQLMSAPGRHENRTQEVSAISRGLKQLAKELKVPVIALSQLSRETERRKDGRPQLSDLRESGALEQDADMVWLLFRPEEYDPKPENAGLAELIIAKQRQGPTGTVRLRFEKEFTRFTAWATQEQEEPREERLWSR